MRTIPTALIALPASRRTPRRVVGAAAWAIVAASVLALEASGATRAPLPERVSVATSAAAPNGESFGAALSGDGRVVAFDSSASNVVSGDTNGVDDLFVRNRARRTTERVSVGAAGEPNGPVLGGHHDVSANGRVVVFASDASNVVEGDANGSADIFARDLASGTTQLISVGTAGIVADALNLSPRVSGDGRFVVFQSLGRSELLEPQPPGSSLVPGDTNGFFDVFVRDRVAGTTERVSVSSSGAQGDAGSFAATISDDGRVVAWESPASNLVAGDTNGLRDVFVRDRQTGTTERVTVGIGGAESNGATVFTPDLSADGRFVAFESSASDLVAGDTNGVEDVFVRDRRTGTTERVSVGTNRAQANAMSRSVPSISADGRLVAFMSEASNLVPGDGNGALDAFFYDRLRSARSSSAPPRADVRSPCRATSRA